MRKNLYISLVCATLQAIAVKMPRSRLIGRRRSRIHRSRDRLSTET